LSGLLDALKKRCKIPWDLVFLLYPTLFFPFLLAFLAIFLFLHSYHNIPFHEIPWDMLALLVLLIAGVSIIVTVFVACRISSPLRDIQTILDDIASKGNLSGHGLSRHAWSFDMERDLKKSLWSVLRELLRRIARTETDLARLRLLFINMKQAVVMLDSKKRVVTMNRAAEEVFGVSEQVAKGKPLSTVFRDIYLQDFLDNVFQDFSDKEAELVLHTGSHGLEKRIFFVRAAVLKPSSTELDEIAGVLLVMDDQTRLRRLENMRRDFVANVSHELKTPVTAIKGYIETLLDGGMDDPETAVQFMEIIRRQSDRLETLVEDILLLSRIEDKVQEKREEFEHVELCALLRSVRDSCLMHANERDITIEIDCPKPSPVMRGSIQLLEQAIANLLVNAINYSSRGSRVILRARGDRDGVVISVQDFGIGIPKEHLPRIFERFYRVDKARSRRLGGTGLGLAIVKHIVQAHGGCMEVESQPGRGSTFSMIFPPARDSHG